MKTLKLYIILITALLFTGLIAKISAAEVNSELPAALALDFQKVLEIKGWRADISGSSLSAWKFNPSYHLLNLSIDYKERDKNTFMIVVDSERGGTNSHKVFLFNNSDSSNIAKMESILTPYLVSLTNPNAEEEKQSDFYASAKFGYYRTNDNREILPEKNEGMIFAGFDIIYDPLKIAGESSVAMYMGDYMDSSFKLTIDRDGEKFFDFFDEFQFDINFVLYGQSSKRISGENSRRNMYGLFTAMEYYRPYLTSDSVVWIDDIYTDHFYIQYCIWEAAKFIHQITLSNNGRDLLFRYELGAGPGFNSSLTATNLTEADEIDLNPIFASNWYGDRGYSDRHENYYYSMAFPLKLEAAADKYLNSKFEIKYHFYYFQSLYDKKAQEFLNRVILNYSYYITEDITAGLGYEFWHVNSFENEKHITHYWNRLNIQMEMKI
jgi:hypothetical protein